MASEESKFPDTLIERVLAPYEIPLTSTLIASIRSYAELLDRWNEKISLTSLRDPVEILRVHFGESFFGVRFIGPNSGRLADIGSGAGFPALPLKLARPGLRVTLIESNARKCAFLSEAVRALKIDQVEVFRGRTEEYPPARELEYVTARAVGQFAETLKWARQRMADGGVAILWIGADGMESIREIPEWQWRSPARIPRTKNKYILASVKKPCST